MTGITGLDFGGKKIRFEKRGDRVWVSLTDMAKATGKLVGNWNQLDGTIKYLSKLEAVIGIPITEINQGGIPEKQGTWAIKQVAIKSVFRHPPQIPIALKDSFKPSGFVAVLWYNIEIV